MQLRHIEIAKLTVSAANMRGRAKVDTDNILPSLHAWGILVPLIVRPNGSPDAFEIVAGKRRYHSALAVAEENDGEGEPLSAVGCSWLPRLQRRGTDDHQRIRWRVGHLRLVHAAARAFRRSGDRNLAIVMAETLEAGSPMRLPLLPFL
jgi:hypothetical protein